MEWHDPNFPILMMVSWAFGDTVVAGWGVWLCTGNGGQAFSSWFRLFWEIAIVGCWLLGWEERVKVNREGRRWRHKHGGWWRLYFYWDDDSNGGNKGTVLSPISVLQSLYVPQHSTQRETDRESYREEEDQHSVHCPWISHSQSKRSSASNEIHKVSCLCLADAMPALIIEAILVRF